MRQTRQRIRHNLTTPAPEPTGRPSDSRRPLFTTLGDDVRAVAQDVQRRGVRRSVSQSFAELEAFYLSDEDRRHLETLDRLPRFFRRLRWFVVSLLMKLRPARRVMLATALLLMLIGIERVSLGDFRVQLNSARLGAFLVLVVLVLELKDKLLARSELEAGRAVQLALMPTKAPVIHGWDAWLYTAPANDVGGDLVDHMQIDERRHFVALADVAGKALPAALLSVKLQATMRALAPGFERLSDLGAALNGILCRDGLPSRFASLAYFELAPDSGHVRVLIAGHLPPFVMRNGSITPLERGSMVLGLVPDASFSEQSIDLAAGETVIIFSDGVTEAMDQAGGFFDDHRLISTLQACDGQPAAFIGSRVLEALSAFVGEAARSDDVSLIVLRRTA